MKLKTLEFILGTVFVFAFSAILSKLGAPIYGVFIICFIVGVIGMISYLSYKDKKAKPMKSRGIRVVIDSADSDAFYSLMEIVKQYRPSILGAQYYDSVTDTLTVNLIVEAHTFPEVFKRISEIENSESMEVNISMEEE